MEAPDCPESCGVELLGFRLLAGCRVRTPPIPERFMVVPALPTLNQPADPAVNAPP